MLDVAFGVRDQWGAPPGVTHCCDMMTSNVDLECHRCSDRYECTDNLVTFIARWQEYGLIIHDGGTSYVTIDFCPWCGARLPESQSDRWFDELEELGIDASDVDNIPEDYLTDRWLSRSDPVSG